MGSMLKQSQAQDATSVQRYQHTLRRTSRKGTQPNHRNLKVETHTCSPGDSRMDMEQEASDRLFMRTSSCSAQ